MPNQDAFAIGRGNAFVATADNPSAIYYNPAGITQLQEQNIHAGSLFYLGIYEVGVTRYFDSGNISARVTFPAQPPPRACTSRPCYRIRICTSAVAAAVTKAKVGVRRSLSKLSAAAGAP
ncbi:MAG: hypothetical protein NT154_18235 [Verrucomicrobia bacterium]|nr:hypothetical protein [Verrucomicrobiota bacterium]